MLLLYRSNNFLKALPMEVSLCECVNHYISSSQEVKTPSSR